MYCFALSSHFATGFSTGTACLGAFLAMFMLMSATLFGAPFTGFCTEPTDTAGEATLAGHGLRTEEANRDAFQATVGAVVGAVQINHGSQTSFTRCRAALTGFNTFIGGVDRD